MKTYVTSQDIQNMRQYRLTKRDATDVDTINTVLFELEQWLARADFANQVAGEWLTANVPYYPEIGAIKYCPFDCTPVLQAMETSYPYSVPKANNEAYPISTWKKLIAECKRYVKGVNQAVGAVSKTLS